MTFRSAMAVLLAVIIVIAAIELSTQVFGRRMPPVAPSASVSEMDTAVPQAPEVDAQAPTPAPAFTW